MVKLYMILLAVILLLFSTTFAQELDIEAKSGIQDKIEQLPLMNYEELAKPPEGTHKVVLDGQAKKLFKVYMLDSTQSPSGVVCEAVSVLVPTKGRTEQHYFLVCSNSMGVSIQNLTSPF